MSTEVFVDFMTDEHVYPVGDLKPHEMVRACWCHPKIIYGEYCDVVVHKSMDEREKYETGERRPH